MSLKEIEAEIKKLDMKDRAALAKWIVESLDDLSEAEIEALWAAEAERRLDGTRTSE
jgi:mRNA-degrading endonuclease RelE of RelBE toxin-antitoxin system